MLFLSQMQTVCEISKINTCNTQEGWTIYNLLTIKMYCKTRWNILVLRCNCIIIIITIIRCLL
jgi:hypothetical protein